MYVQSMIYDGPFRGFVIAAKALLLIALPFLAYGFGVEVLALADQPSFSSSRFLLLGAALFVPVWWLCKRFFWRPWQFVCTLEHELTHALVGIPFFMFPYRIHATADRGGHVNQAWLAPVVLAPLYGPGAILSGLAPYFFPTTSYILIVSGLFFLDSHAAWFLIVLGFLTAFHIVSTWAETSYSQPDIHKAGPVFTTLFLLVANLIALGGIAAFVAGGPLGFQRYWPEAFWRSIALATHLVALSLNTFRA